MSATNAQHEVQARAIQCNGISLHCLQCGPPDGDLVIFLHGFPEHAGSWQSYLAEVAAQGYLAIAPDQRGYGRSSKPTAIKDYGLDVLSADIVSLIGELGRQRAHIVGHDWGGGVAWWLAHTCAEFVQTVTILNVPHPYVMKNKLLFGSLRQMLRSWYIMAFQLPAFPQWMLRRNNFAAMQQALLTTSVPGTFEPTDLAHHIDAWQQPGALTAMVNWYRASLWAEPKPPPTATIDVPLLLIWGERDHVLGTELIEPSMQLTQNGEVVRFADASHWINHEKMGEVLSLLNKHWHK